jgi:putative DNA primase/helicase
MTTTEERVFFMGERFGRGEEAPFEERFPCTDAGNAELFAHLNADRLRFDHRQSRWLEWAGHWWHEDRTQQVVQQAIRAARYRYHQADSISDPDMRKAVAKWAIQSENRSRVESCLALAKSVWPISDSGEGWDGDSWLLGVENGVIDLRLGALREGRREDRITRHAPVKFDPRATCPGFETFLQRVQPDPEISAYLRRRAGYSMTGDVGEQDLVFFHGSGANGKTTFVSVLMDTLGPDFSKQAAPGLLLKHYNDRHPTEIADLDGSRLLVSVEVEEGRALAEELVKQLTGGDRLKARRMREDFYEFEPTFKIFLLANHKPTVTGTDYAIWRRIKLVPWNVTVPLAERDRSLRQKLRREAPGIFNWMLAGCLDWQSAGMQEPASIATATEAYRAESDPISEFIEDRCVTGDHYFVATGAAYSEFQSWESQQGVSTKDQSHLTQKAFGTRLGERFRRGRGHRGERGYHGIGLLSARQEGLTDRAAFDASAPDLSRFESEPSELGVGESVEASRDANRKNASDASIRQKETLALSPWEEEMS